MAVLNFVHVSYPPKITVQPTDSLPPINGTVHNRPFYSVCLVAWPLNENEAGGDLVLIETSLFFLCKFVLITMRTTSLT